MPIILMNGPFANTMPMVELPVLIDRKENWSDGWSEDGSLRFTGGKVSSASDGLSYVRFTRPYGTRVMQEWQADFNQRRQIDIADWWIRAKVLNEGGNWTFFIGRIGPETQELYGRVSSGSTGEQEWTAYGALQLLRKLSISTSKWIVDTDGQGAMELNTIGWLPAMNDRDKRGWLSGNRTYNRYAKDGSADVNGSHVFGGADIWNHRDMCEYLITHYLDESASGGPTWTLGGQVDILEQLQETLNFGKASTAASMLRQLIPPERGLDYFIASTDDGFEIRVFSLLGDDYSFGGDTLPANPVRVHFDATASSYVDSCTVERTGDNRFGKIRILGQRILVCCSLYGSAAEGPYGTTLVHRAPPDLVSEYQNPLPADPNATAEDCDRARQADKFRDVYSHFGIPADWDHNGGTARPAVGADGQLAVDDPATPATDEAVADRQLSVRATLPYLPLKENVDYWEDPANDHNANSDEPEFLPPQVWIERDNADPADTTKRYDPVDKIGISVSVCQLDWGVFLRAHPQHKLADDEWLASYKTETTPDREYGKLVATIAFHTDQRLILEIEQEGAVASDGVLDIDADFAEMHLLLPETVVGIDDHGELLKSGSEVRVLRNDYDRMKMVAAGAIARYHAERAKAVIVMQGTRVWNWLLGKILETVNDGANQQRVAGPITSVRWGDSKTTIGTGYVDTRPAWEDKFPAVRPQRAPEGPRIFGTGINPVIPDSEEG